MSPSQLSFIDFKAFWDRLKVSNGKFEWRKERRKKKHTHTHNTIGWNIKDQTFNPYFRMAYTKTDICQLVKYNLMLFVSFFGSLTTSLGAHIHISLTSRTPFIRDFAHFFWRIFYGAWLKERQSNVRSANNNRHKNTCAELQSIENALSCTKYAFSVARLMPIYITLCAQALAKGSKILRFDGRKIFIK